MPQLYYIPNNMLNAFAAGQQKDAGVAFTHGLLRTLNMRELTGVLAHEISHLGNKDLQLKSMVNVIFRLSRFFSFAGQFLLFLYLPWVLVGEPPFSWIGVILLILSPTLMALMVSAFSRTREFEADLEAARLTGDPNGLADALKKLDYYNQGGILAITASSGAGLKYLQWLSSHPSIEERIARLRGLAPQYEARTTWPTDSWAGFNQPLQRPWPWMGW